MPIRRKKLSSKKTTAVIKKQNSKREKAMREWIGKLFVATIAMIVFIVTAVVVYWVLKLTSNYLYSFMGFIQSFGLF